MERASMATDAELVKASKAGDLDAFGVLLRRYEKTALGFAHARLRDFQKAEDVVQECFVLAFRKLNTLSDPSSFGAWLMRICRNQLVDAVRSSAGIVTVSMQAIENHLPISMPSADSDLWTDELAAALDALPDADRTIIGLRYFDNHSVATISEMTDRPVGSVTKQLTRARRQLRDRLERSIR